MSEQNETRRSLALKKVLAIGAATLAFAVEPTAVGFQADEQARQELAGNLVGLDTAVMGAAGMIAFAKRAAEANRVHVAEYAANTQTTVASLPPTQR